VTAAKLLEVTTLRFQRLSRKVCLKIQIKLQPALQAGLMQLRRKILQILADFRIIIGGENQFSNEEFSGFRRIGNSVKT